MDLNTLDTTEVANEGIDVTIIDPVTNEDTDIVITILGQDSDAYKEAQRIYAAKHLSTALKTQAKREQKMVDLTDESIPHLLAAATMGWKGMTIGGQPFEYSKPNAVKLYQSYPVIREQVLEKMRDRANFLKR